MFYLYPMPSRRRKYEKLYRIAVKLALMPEMLDTEGNQVHIIHNSLRWAPTVEKKKKSGFEEISLIALWHFLIVLRLSSTIFFNDRIPVTTTKIRCMTTIITYEKWFISKKVFFTVSMYHSNNTQQLLIHKKI